MLSLGRPPACCRDSTVVKWFWEIVRGLPLEQKRQLLMFVTGSDRWGRLGRCDGCQGGI